MLASGISAMKLQQGPFTWELLQAEIPIIKLQLSYTAAALQPHLCLAMYPTDPNPDPDPWTQLPDLISDLPCCCRHWLTLLTVSRLILTLNCCLITMDLVTITGLDLFHLVQILWDFPTATEATTFSCLPVTLGYWMPLYERPTLVILWQYNSRIYHTEVWPSEVTDLWGCSVLYYRVCKVLHWFVMANLLVNN